MTNDAKVGLGVVGAMALCCGGPSILSALASGAALGAVGAALDGGRLWFPGAVAGLLGLGAAVWLVARRFTSQSDPDAARRAPTLARVGAGQRDEGMSRPAPGTPESIRPSAHREIG